MKTDEQQVAFLLSRISNRDLQALEALYRLMETGLYSFAYSRLHDPHAAAEVLTETMMDIWKNAGRFEGRSKASTWVFAIARYKILNLLKSAGKHSHEELDPEFVDESTPAELDSHAAMEDASALHRCIKKLSASQREVILLTFFHDMSYNDIADITSSPVGTVKSRMFHARSALKQCLNLFSLNIQHVD